MKVRVLVFLLMAIVAAAPASAQGDVPDPAKVRVRIGPLLMNPTLSLTNLGVDDNVFNEETNPKRDFTFTISPKTDLWLRAGRTWVKGTINEDIVWYQKYSSERSANNSYTVSWLVPLNRLSMTAAASRTGTRERPDAEIDARAPRTETSYKGTAAIRVLSKTAIGVGASRTRTAFDEGTTFLNVMLRDELTRAVTTNSVNINHKLTPLTSIALEFGLEDVQFDFSPDRDNQSRLVTGTISFDPFAVLKGSASLGFRDFKPVSPEVPGYQGTTAAADLSYTLHGATRVGARVMRDVQFSFDARTPYFLQTGYSLEIMQQIFGPVDVAVRYGRTNMAYRDREDVVVLAGNRVDRVRSYGVGIGYHLGQDIRVAVNFDEQKRASAVNGRNYEGLKIGTAITYGY